MYMKGLKQLFLFFVPTLMVGLVFISISQQNIFVADDDNYDIANIKIESQSKYTTNVPAPLVFYIISKNFKLPLLVLYSSIVSYAIVLNRIDSLRNLKGRSPPKNT